MSMVVMSTARRLTNLRLLGQSVRRGLSAQHSNDTYHGATVRPPDHADGGTPPSQGPWLDAVTVTVKGHLPPPGQRGDAGIAVCRELEDRVKRSLVGTPLSEWNPVAIHSDDPYVDLLPPTVSAASLPLSHLEHTLANIDGIEPRFEIHAWDGTGGFREDELVPTSGIPGVGLGIQLLGSGSIFDQTHLPQTDDNPWWSIDAINLDRMSALTGNGVVVAHPDSGYRQHPEFDPDRVNTDLARDFWKNDANPKVTPTESRTYGRHGTGTGSVIFSGRNAVPNGDYGPVVNGVAPGATIVPLRVTAPGWICPGPMLLSARTLSDAIHYAADKVDIISMSLGMGWHTQRLHKAVQRARRHGVIVVAAAGNYTYSKAIYPAAFDEVVSVAASNAHDKPWSWSGFGDHVDIAAPGESVWRAYVNDSGEQVVRRGTGTSYATAHIAGLAALWLESHGGRRELIRRNGGYGISAGDRGIAVGDSFKKALFASGCQGTKIGSSSYGHGIVDAAMLLADTL
eukprot:m.11170 g.11170  ORF g.11170 m.11170 type:complete len:512 (-) comp7300_c0_seq1:176-1711(-)